MGPSLTGLFLCNVDFFSVTICSIRIICNHASLVAYKHPIMPHSFLDLKLSLYTHISKDNLNFILINNNS